MAEPGRFRRTWRAQSLVVRDLPLALVVAVAPLVPALQHQGTELGGLPTRPMDALAVVAVALQALPLAVRRRWPSVCLALVSLGFAVDQLRGYHTAAAAAIAIAVFSTAAHLGHRRRATAVAASAAYAVLATTLARNGGTEGVAGFVTFYLALAIIWAGGSWLRQSRAVEAERRSHAAEAARAAERRQLARELHDVVTHHVTAMVVQAEAARFLTTEPERLDQALTAITDTGRSAVDDLRQLLDVLSPAQSSNPRTPPAGDLLELIEQTRQAGQPVEYRCEGETEQLAGSVSRTVYRVVQESLTNALKYARGSRTVVDIRYDEADVEVEVGTDATTGGDLTSAVRGAAPGGSGRGLVGMRERVELLGGELSAGLQPDGRFVVRARVPAGRDA